MIEIRLEYGGMRATNTTHDDLIAAHAIASEMLQSHGIERVSWRHGANQVRNPRHLTEATGRSFAGNRAFLYIFDTNGVTR